MSKQSSIKEQNRIKLIEENETVKYQDEVLKRLEEDQHLNMARFPKHFDDLLEGTSKPNHSVLIKQSNRNFDNYVNQHIISKLKHDEYIHNMNENIRKKQLKEVQNYQKLQIFERDHVAKLKIENERKVAKEIISRDLKDIDKYFAMDDSAKKIKQIKLKDMLDEQIRKDQQAREKNLGLEHREYALNAAKIKDVINRF